MPSARDPSFLQNCPGWTIDDDNVACFGLPRPPRRFSLLLRLERSTTTITPFCRQRLERSESLPLLRSRVYVPISTSWNLRLGLVSPFPGNVLTSETLRGQNILLRLLSARVLSPVSISLEFTSRAGFSPFQKRLGRRKASRSTTLQLRQVSAANAYRRYHSLW